MGKSINQHWVPQFYLRGFSTPETKDKKEKQVWAFHKDEGDPFLVNVKDIAAQRYLYTPQAPDGTRDWSIDDSLTDLEGLVGKIWPAVAHDFVDLSSEAIRKGLSLFIATLILRHPSKIADVKCIHGKMLEIWESAPKDSNGVPFGNIEINGKEYEIDNSDWEEYSNPTEYDHHKNFAHYIRSEAIFIAELLLKKRWSIVVSESPVFITTDSPVVMENSEREVYGVDTKGTFITFPLSPTRMLCMDDWYSEPASEYFSLSEKSGPAFNQIHWNYTYRFMISSRNPAEVLSEIINFSESLVKEVP